MFRTPERSIPLAGDELLARADASATRGITIRASAADVWPWIAQLGQGRGGFYSYDFLENLVGCHMRSADSIVPQWQDIEAGSEVRLHPKVALLVAAVEPPRALVLRGGVPMGPVTAPYDFTWSFIVTSPPSGGARLIVRERYSYRRRWAPLIVRPTILVSYFMSRRMMHGIKARAERTTTEPSPTLHA